MAERDGLSTLIGRDRGPRRVTVQVSPAAFTECLPYLMRLGRVVACRPPEDFFAPGNCSWTVEIENAAWPSGPDGEATVKVHEFRQAQGLIRWVEITLPGQQERRAAIALVVGMDAFRKAAAAISELINIAPNSPRPAEIEELLVKELGA